MSSPFVASEDPILGRTIEIARVRRLVERMEQGHGAAAFIEGEAGIGKTSLLAAVIATVPSCK